jgi:plastocyanin
MKSNNISTKKLLSALAIIIVVFGLLLVFMQHSKENKKTRQPAKSEVATAVVRITEDGFQPSNLKVKAGTLVVWTNDDTEPHRIASNPYPTHKDLPSLDSKSSIDTNGKYRYTFNQKGTFGYHDELNPDVNGTVIIE